jgi:hypothetical protein
VGEGSQLTVSVNATDPDMPGQTLTYSLGQGAPAGAAIGALSGVFTWIPDPYTSTGTYAVTVIVTDNGPIPKSDRATFTISVLAVNHPPVIGSIPALTAAPKHTLQFALAPFVSDPDRPMQALAYSLAPGAPAGANINPISGVFTWVVPSSQHMGSYPIGIVVTDGGSPPLAQAASFTVTVIDTGPPPTILRASVITKHGYAITLKFSQPLDPATALNPNNYILIPTKVKKLPPSPQALPIPLSVSYNSTTNVVSLTAMAHVTRKQTLKLTVIGTPPGGVAKITGRLMAGRGKRSGSDYVATISGKSVVLR